jgi:hypothetical protein
VVEAPASPAEKEMEMKNIIVQMEYGDTNQWDEEEISTVRGAVELASQHLNSPSSCCGTRVRITERDGSVRQISDYGHSDSYIDGPKYFAQLR